MGSFDVKRFVFLSFIPTVGLSVFSVVGLHVSVHEESQVTGMMTIEIWWLEGYVLRDRQYGGLSRREHDPHESGNSVTP